MTPKLSCPVCTGTVWTINDVQICCATLDCAVKIPRKMLDNSTIDEIKRMGADFLKAITPKELGDD